jgi:hypothetical protein
VLPISRLGAGDATPAAGFITFLKETHIKALPHPPDFVLCCGRDHHGWSGLSIHSLGFKSPREDNATTAALAQTVLPQTDYLLRPKDSY